MIGPKRHGWSIVAVVLSLAVILAGCGAGASVGEPQNGDAGQAGAPDDRAAEGGGQPGEGSQGEGDQPPPFADLLDRQIVKTGEVSLEVASVAEAVGAVRAMALDLGGYVGGSRAGDSDESATLTLRIPADRFDAAIAELHEMDGEVVAEATREEDVTASVVDLEARIRNLEASETQYRALLDRATEIEDILTVQSRLDEVRGRIEQLQAQLDQLSGLANLATLTVTLLPVAAPVEETAEAWDAGAIFDSALAALVSLGQGVATVAIWLGIVGVPLVLVGGMLALLALRATPTLRRGPVRPEGPASPTE